jgi:protoporphyrinogen oxidase
MSTRIGIIGGGIAGLASAYRLASRGHQVTVLEASDSLGGLGTFFDLEGRKVDRFYHCIMPSDGDFLELIEDLGQTEKLYWDNTLMGMVYNGQHYPFNTPLDLLKFSPLSIVERMRLGAMSLLLSRLGNDAKLDGTPIEHWLRRLFGGALWTKFWGPMFSAKFGENAPKLPALYLKKRLGRESNVATRGYIEGGLFGLIQTLETAIERHNGSVQINSPVSKISQDNGKVTVSTNDSRDLEFDYVISTIPLNLLSRAASGIDGIEALPTLAYQGVVNMLILLDKPLDSYYWTPSLFSGTEFDGIVESSALIKTEQYGGYHAAYVMKYTSRESDLFATAETDIATRWTSEFLKVYESRGITQANIKKVLVFKAPFVEPIYPLNYTKVQPQSRIGHSNVYLATTAQVYPYITSWNSSIRVANGTVRILLDRIEKEDL